MYRKSFTILSSDVDPNRKLKLSVLYKQFQEAAIAHTTKLGMGREKTLDKGLLWIITMEQLWIDRLPEYDEKVTLYSWPGKTMTMLFPRYYVLKNESGKQLLEASSIWALISKDKRQLVFADKYGIKIEEEKGKKIPMPSRILMKDLEKRSEMKVPYSYADINMHMNNTRYLDLAYDHMPKKARNKTISGVRSEFVSELKTDDILDLYDLYKDNSYYLEGRKANTCCFRQVISFK